MLIDTTTEHQTCNGLVRVTTFITRMYVVIVFLFFSYTQILSKKPMSQLKSQ